MNGRYFHRGWLSAVSIFKKEDFGLLFFINWSAEPRLRRGARGVSLKPLARLKETCGGGSRWNNLMFK